VVLGAVNKDYEEDPKACHIAAMFFEPPNNVGLKFVDRPITNMPRFWLGGPTTEGYPTADPWAPASNPAGSASSSHVSKYSYLSSSRYP